MNEPPESMMGGGISPTISARDYKGAIKILEDGNKVDKVGGHKPRS